MAMPLLMANSPVPGCYTDYYYDFQVNYLGSTFKDDVYLNNAHVINTGNGYMADSIWVGTSKNNSDLSYYSIEVPGSPFYDQVIAPGQEFDITFATQKEIETKNDTKIYYTGHAFANIDTTAVVEGSLQVSKYDYSYNEDRNLYEVDINLTNTDGNYYYRVVLEMTYDGNVFYVTIPFYKNNLIETIDSFDLTKLTNVSVKAVVKDDFSRYGCGGINFKGLLIGFLITMAILSVLIFLSIFLPITITKSARRRRQRAREAANKNN